MSAFLNSGKPLVRVRFGPYDLDPEAHVLRKRGISIRLQEQPWQVLCALLEKPGEVVTREELQKRLWPEGTFVDFDQSLNKAVNKLRDALSDTAGEPRYVETLARRGYRFVADVEEVAAPPVPVAVLPVKPPKRKPWRSIGGVAAVLAAILITGLWPLPQPAVRVTQLTNDRRVTSSWLAVTGGRIIYSGGGLGKNSSMVELWSVPTAGGEVRREPTPCADGQAAGLVGVSYLRQRLLLPCTSYGSGLSDLWMMGFDGSSPKSIGHLEQQVVSISPSLETLLFSRPEGLFAKPVDGSAERQLVRPDIWNLTSYTFWHPAGDRIGFIRRVGGLYKVWQVRTDGTGLRPLVPEFAGEQYAALWSPKGQRLYFVSQGDIYLQRSRGWLGWMRRAAPVRLTSGPIKFSLPHEDPANPLVIYAVGSIPQATAMKLNRRTNAWEPFLGGLAADCFDFSRDGQWIAYVSWPGGELWKCRRDGSGNVLLEDNLFCLGLHWSPDGSRIAFDGSKRGRTAAHDWTRHIYTVSAAGGKPEPVPGVPGPASNATWSPDGKRLAWAPYCGDVVPKDRHVSIVNLNTGAVEAVPGSGGLFAAEWSPDGKWLAAASCDKIWPYIYSFATQKWAVLQPRAIGWLDWSRDSRYLHFIQWVPALSIGRIEVATGKEEEIRKLSDFEISGVIGAGAYWTPEEEPVVVKGAANSQICRIERDR